MNQDLREHVTRTGFNLDLGKLHLYHLVKIAEGKAGFLIGPWRPASARSGWTWYDSQYIKGHRGLEERGLITWSARDVLDEQGRKAFGEKARFAELTIAGEAVVTLLRESGLYRDYAKVWATRKQSA